MDKKKKILKSLKNNGQGLSISEIAEKTNMHRHTVSRYILELKAKEVISIRKVGPTKLCFYNGIRNSSKGISSFIPLLIIASALLISGFYFYPNLFLDQTSPMAKILNTQSYPTQYGNWTVSFTTNGTSDMIITPYQGTEWSDLDPIEIVCDNKPIEFEKQDSYLFIEDYSCPGESKLTNKVLTSGVHVLKFDFGGTSNYAHNLAGQTICGVSFGNIVYEFNDSSGLDIMTIDSSGNLYIAAPNVEEAAGTIPSSSNGFSISSSGDKFMFNNTHAYLIGNIYNGSVPSATSSDILIKNSSNGASLALFQGNGDLHTLNIALYQGVQGGCTGDEVDFSCNTGSGNIEWWDYYCDIESGCSWQFSGNMKEDCQDTCTDTGDNWLDKESITDCELCTDSHTACSQDCSTRYDYCDGSTVYDRNCGATDESTASSIVCTDYCFSSGGSTGSGVNYPYRGTDCSNGECTTSLCPTGCSGCTDQVGCTSGECRTEDCPTNTKCNGDVCTASGYCGYGSYTTCSEDKCTRGKQGLRCTGGSCSYGTGTYIYDLNCGANTYCSGGNCYSGACTTSYHCTGDNKCQYTCDGSGDCDVDYNCQDCDYQCQGSSGDANCKTYDTCTSGSCTGTTNCQTGFHCSSGSGCVSGQCSTTDYCQDSNTKCTGKKCDGSGNCDVDDGCSDCSTSCSGSCKVYTGSCSGGSCTTSNCALGKYCTGGSCVYGKCSDINHCDSNNRYCDGYSCNGAGSCSQDYGCQCSAGHCGATCSNSIDCDPDDCPYANCCMPGCYCECQPQGVGCPV